jgi:signal recognition particle receptor subunit beta
MEQQKIIFTGPVGAGKTTAIAALSDIKTVRTDARASDMTAAHKEQTTVALDYGLMKLDNGERVHLYGTPGQERFDFMWDILSAGGIGLVLLLDNTRADPFQDMHFFIKAFEQLIRSSPLVIGVTRVDLRHHPCVHEYHAALRGSGLNPPIFQVEARQRSDVRLLVQALLYSLDPGLSD